MDHRPLVLSAEYELPFSQLSWEQFERLCLRLIRRRGYQHPEHLGRGGADGGCDIRAWVGEVPVLVQCKRVRDFSAADGLRAVDRLRASGTAVPDSRLLLFVTCSVSSEARSRIREAWGGPPSWSEIVGVTELEAEVRSTSTILREFFRGSSSPDRTDDGKTRREIHDIAVENHTWVQRTGNFHFERLLRAIDEISVPAGHIEAGRAFASSLEESGALSMATPPRLLDACARLAQMPTFQLNWQLRRMLARVIGDVLGIQLDSRDRVTVQDFCEARLDSPTGALLLAEAAVEHTAAARAIGEPNLRRLLNSPHRQASWQLLRRWPVVSPVMSDSREIHDIMAVRDVATERMLWIAEMVAVRASARELRALLSTVRALTGDHNGSRLARLFDALAAWARMNTAVDVGRISSFEPGISRIDHLLYSAETLGSDTTGAVAGAAAQALEFDSVDRDVRNADGTYYSHPSERSEGRYGFTKHYVRRVINIARDDQMAVLLGDLARSSDEGVRWGLAAELENWWVRLDGAAIAADLTMTLIGDSHPWVVRETLGRLADDPVLAQAIGVREIVRDAEASRARAAQNGWPVGEVAAAARRVAALAPPP